MDQKTEYGQVFENALALAARRSNWFPFKWCTLYYLQAAARDDSILDLAVRTQTQPDRAAAPLPLPTLAEIIDLLFELAIQMYGPLLPFGGKYARKLKDIVLEFLGELLVPPALMYRKQ